MKKKYKWVTVAAMLAAAAAAFCIWQNNGLTVSHSVLTAGNVPSAFDGYTIVQISDLHNKEFGGGQRRLLSKLAEQDPDLIVITGDMIDSRWTDVGPALDFARKAVKLAPCFYVPGNHEKRVPDAYEELKAGLADCGVKILENEKISLEQDGAELTMVGVLDPVFCVGTADEAGNLLIDERSVMKSQLAELVAQSADSQGGEFTVLLSHRPELLDLYGAAGVDLVFAGHAHGGQWRLPGLGGLIAPMQGFFPKYTDGVHTSGRTAMYISRGLGNSLIPIRIFNRPELVVVELQCGIGQNRSST